MLKDSVDSLRRVQRLTGAESPLRPTEPFAKPSMELVGALGQLTEAFQQLRGLLDGVDQKVEALGGGLARAAAKVDTVHDRLDVVGGRMTALEARMEALEARQGESAGTLQRRVGDLSRQVGFALGLALMLGILAIVALIAIR